MQKPQTHSHKFKRQLGFTLIEIIVVVAIIGTMVALLGVRFSRDTNRLAKLEAERFHMVVNEVRDEAILVGESFILQVAKDGSYAFESARKRSEMSHDGLLKRRFLESGVEVSWDVLEDVAQDDDGAEAAVAQGVLSSGSVLITPLGEITPFEIEFVGDEKAYTVYVDEQNRVARR